MAEEEVILKATGLTKEFKGFVAVKNVERDGRIQLEDGRTLVDDGKLR